ncbi:MAG: hypothetical protein M1819_002587 [Sarea resinae]|nr:MAG: hypothetical protein M1819_002587 [Sarea resinae]
MSDASDGEDGLAGGVRFFQEPEGYFEPAKPATFAEHQLISGKVVTVRLVGHNPLWGHFLWNGGRVLSHYLEERAAELVKGKDVLELGAGSGLPSLVSAICGANAGYIWGASAEKVSSHLSNPSAGFDLLILADLLFNHSEHGKLINTLEKSLKKTGDSHALVFFTPYRPWLLDKDLAFFDRAKEAGFKVEKIMEKVIDKVMFEEDPGVGSNNLFSTNMLTRLQDELLRRTVYGFDVRWNSEKQDTGG